jgi:hypothetical protein
VAGGGGAGAVAPLRQCSMVAKDRWLVSGPDLGSSGPDGLRQAQMGLGGPRTCVTWELPGDGDGGSMMLGLAATWTACCSVAAGFADLVWT